MKQIKSRSHTYKKIFQSNTKIPKVWVGSRINLQRKKFPKPKVETKQPTKEKKQIRSKSQSPGRMS